MFKSKINTYYEKHDCSRICQGDLLRDYKFQLVDRLGNVKEFFFPYLIVLTQDCDLKQYYNFDCIKDEDKTKCNQYLPNVLVSPGFLAEDAREGNHLKNLFDITQERINTDKWRAIKDNKEERYHYLPEYKEFQIPNILIDFKSYFTISYLDLNSNHCKHYLATINELFRERFSQRFCNYLGRIGLPEV